MVYFIDECGHTGDLAKSADFAGLKEQPLFAMAAVGLADESSWAREMEHLKMAHRIQATELKSSARGDRAEFTLDVVRLICQHAKPWFVEVVDKKFQIAANIVTNQVIPPVWDPSHAVEAHQLQNAIADYIYEYAPSELYRKFVEACLSPSDEALRTQLELLMEFPRELGWEPVGEMMRAFVRLSWDEYCEAVDNGRADAHLRYLPIPDRNKQGRLVWILPNLSSLTNIYARINRYSGRKLKGVHLVHDEQIQYDVILQSAKQSEECMQENAERFYAPFSDYVFADTAPLEFGSSKTSIGIQTADLLAGFVMRYVKDFMTDRRSISPAAHKTYDLLRRSTNSANSVGLNLVVSTRLAMILNLAEG